MGGGPDNTLSIWSEFKPLLQGLLGHDLDVTHRDERPGDQPVYVSDIRKAGEVLGWRPKVPVREGVRRLYDWINANQCLFGHL